MTDHADLTARARSWKMGRDDPRAVYSPEARARRLITELADALDAADAENARLTAERDGLAGTLAYWKNLLTTRTATLYERAERAEAYRDEARARVAERDATIELLVSWLHRIEKADTLFMTHEWTRQALADTAPTPKVSDV